MTLQSLCPPCGFSEMWIADGGSSISQGNALLHTLGKFQPSQEVSRVRTSLQLPLGKGFEVCSTMGVSIVSSPENCGGYKSVWKSLSPHGLSGKVELHLNNISSLSWGFFFLFLTVFFLFCSPWLFMPLCWTLKLGELESFGHWALKNNTT